MEEDNLEEPSVLLLFRKLIDRANPGLNLLKVQLGIKFPNFSRLAETMADQDMGWIWLCYIQLELFINPEAAVNTLFETALRTAKNAKIELWLAYIDWSAEANENNFPRQDIN